MNPWDREVFARTLWMGARSEGTEGLRAVAHVIRNRFLSQHDSFAGKTSIALVCMADQRFSVWNASRSDRNRERVSVLHYDDPTIEICRRVVDQVMSGNEQDPTEGSTHYLTRACFENSPPDWAKDRRPHKVIRNHLFFRGVAPRKTT